MGKIAACMCIYNAADLIRKSLDAVVDQVDKVVVVDGAYLGFPSGSLFSDDGTLDILKEYGDKILLIQVPKRMSQPEKRSLYFVEDFSWYLIIDDDDLVVGDVRAAVTKLERTPEADSGLITCMHSGVPLQYMRLLRYKPGLHYYGAHHDIRDWNNDENSWHPLVITEFEIHDMPRCPERDKKWEIYQSMRLFRSRQDYSFEGV